MPFVINGQKLNKPIYKGTILNAIHVWLQNHWTGTANASTSTLSQDGRVVATNSHKDPNALRQKSMLKCTATQVGSHWRYTSTDANESGITNFISSDIPVGTVVYYKLSADDDIRTVLERATLLKQNSDGERWWSISTVGYHAIYFVGSGTGGSGVGQSITLERFAQYTPQDYAALQARGVTWFDGDSVFNLVTAKASVEIRGAF